MIECIVIQRSAVREDVISPNTRVITKNVLKCTEMPTKCRETSNSSFLPPGLELLGRLLSFRRTLAEVITFSEASMYEFSPISNCPRSKSAIFFSHNINYNINSLLRLSIGSRIIYIYIYLSIYLSIYISYLSDERNIPEVEMETI